MAELYVFTFRSIIKNQNMGYHYNFIAHDIEEAKIFAKTYQDDFNRTFNNSSNYKLDLHIREDYRPIPLIPGLLPNIPKN